MHLCDAKSSRCGEERGFNSVVDPDPDPHGSHITLKDRIRIRIKEKGRIRIRIKKTNRIRIRIKVKGRIRIRTRLRVMRIRNTGIQTWKCMAHDGISFHQRHPITSSWTALALIRYIRWSILYVLAHTVKKVSGFPVSGRDITTRNNSIIPGRVW
jgi:hypothetical protein